MRSVIVYRLCDFFGNDFFIFILNNCRLYYKVKFVFCDGVVVEEVGVKGWFSYNFGNKVYGFGLYVYVLCDFYIFACVLDYCRFSYVVEV